MPLYEYRCTACGTEFESLVARAGDPAPHCPRCDAAGAERRWSTFAVVKSAAAPSPGPCGASDCACRSREESGFTRGDPS